MKKIGFTLQVLGLLIMLPLYVILELNHTAAKLPSTNPGVNFKSPETDKNFDVKEIASSDAKSVVKYQIQAGRDTKY